MLEVTGTLKGKIYKEEIVTAEYLMEAFGLDFLKGKEKVTFKLNEDNPNVVKKNKADGKLRFPASFGFTTFINGFYEGANLQIRYYTSKVNNGPNLKPKYTPNRLRMNGKAKPLNTTQDKEEALFWLLFPHCKDSPLHDPRRHPAVYLLDDVEKTAKVKMEKEALELKLRTSILGLPDDLAVQIALGIKLGRYSIPPEEAENPVSAKVALIELAKRDPGGLQDAMSSKPVMIDGAIVLAKKRGLIHIAPGANQKKAWYYADSLGGERIIPLPSKGNPNKELAKYLSTREAWMNFQEITGIGKKEGEAPEVAEELPAFEMNEDAKVIQEGIDNRCVVLHPKENKVYIMEPSGHLQDRALLIIKDRKTWKEELLSRANSMIAGRVRKRLEEGAVVV